MKAAVEKKGDKELSQDFEKAFGQLESGSHLDGTKLDDFLEREIEDMKARDGQIQGSFGRGGDGRSFGGYGQQQQGGFGGQRQPRYADDGQQQQQQSSRYGYGGGSGGGFRSRQSFGQDGQTREGRTDMASADGESTHSSRSDTGFQRTGRSNWYFTCLFVCLIGWFIDRFFNQFVCWLIDRLLSKLGFNLFVELIRNSIPLGICRVSTPRQQFYAPREWHKLRRRLSTASVLQPKKLQRRGWRSRPLQR